MAEALPASGVAGVVPCAGESVRMGTPKALLDGGGSTFLERVVAALSGGGCDPIVVVVPHEDEPVRAIACATGALVREGDRPELGPIGSLRVALASLDDDVRAVAVLPVDHPLVRPATVARLIAALAGSEAAVVVPRHRGERGHPVLFGRSVFPELFEDDLAEGARTVVHRHLADLLHVDVDDPGVLADIDTPEDYRRHFGRVSASTGRGA